MDARGAAVKLAIISDEISQDLGVAIGLALAHGFTGLEIRSVGDTPPHELSRTRCRSIREQLAVAGIELVAFDSPAFKHALPLTRREYDEAARTLEASIAIARALGCPPTRIFSFYRDGQPAIDAAAEAMAKLLDRVSCADVPLLLENGMRTNCPTASTLAELSALLAPRLAGVLWDPGNAAFSGLESLTPRAAHGLLRDRLRLVHVKDPSGSDFYTRLGEGDVPWAEIVAMLADDRFPGFLSLETHWRRDRILSQTERDTPWGRSFSEDGAEPSSICMMVLAEMARGGSNQPLAPLNRG
jgi:sugar phosphate isomerase/epimerase